MSQFVKLQPQEAKLNGALRFFDCARCGKRTFIFRRDERGHIYFSEECRLEARRSSQKGAGKRYRKSLRSRLNHADRQKRYRKRKKIETHSGSTSFPAPPKQAPGPKRKEPGPYEAPKKDTFSSPASPDPSFPKDGIYTCSFCGRVKSWYPRTDFLHTLNRSSSPVLFWKETPV